MNEVMTIENIWDSIYTFWQEHDNEVMLLDGDELNMITQLEDKLNIKLPIDFKKSLNYKYHPARKETNDYRYTWFGDSIEINFLSAKDIIKEYNVCLDEIEAQENVYSGNIIPYKNKDWSKNWIPILTRTDIDIIVFIDLRENIGEQYGQILLYQPDIEIDDTVWAHHISHIAPSYKDFLEAILEELRKNQGVNNSFFTPFLYKEKKENEDSDKAKQEKEMSLKDTIKAELLLWFLNNQCNAGDSMSREEFSSIISKYVNGYIDTQNACDDALDELFEDELISDSDVIDASLSITHEGLVFAKSL